jgi:hypothetical protein
MKKIKNVKPAISIKNWIPLGRPYFNSLENILKSNFHPLKVLYDNRYSLESIIAINIKKFNDDAITDPKPEPIIPSSGKPYVPNIRT